MEKREFIKKASLAVLGAPFYGSALANNLSAIQDIAPEKLATRDDFWLKVRKDYNLKPDYINLGKRVLQHHSNANIRSTQKEYRLGEL